MGFFNLVFIINVSILINKLLLFKIDKTGLTKKTKDDGIYAPLILVILSALLCYGLAVKKFIFDLLNCFFVIRVFIGIKILLYLIAYLFCHANLQFQLLFFLV